MMLPRPVSSYFSLGIYISNQIKFSNIRVSQNSVEIILQGSIPHQNKNKFALFRINDSSAIFNGFGKSPIIPLRAKNNFFILKIIFEISNISSSKIIADNANFF